MKSKLANIGVVCVWVALWAVAACAVGSPVVLASPAETMLTLIGALQTPAFWVAIGATFWHIAAGLIAACIFGCAMGVAASRWRAFEAFFSPAIHFVKSAPIVCFVVLLLVWFGSSYVDLAAVFLAVLPLYYTSMREACDHRDVKLAEMLQVFRVPFWRRVRVFEWPTVQPFFMQSTKVAVGMAWKSGVTAELIGITFASVGEQIYLSKLTLDTAGLFAWTIVIVLLSWVCEKLVLWLVGRIGCGGLGQGSAEQGSAEQGAQAGAEQSSGGAAQMGAMRAEAVTASDSEPASAFASAPARIAARDVSKTFGQVAPVSHFSYVFEPGSRTCIMAPTGTGKTTLLNLLLGLEAPDEGAVESACAHQSAALFSAVFQEARLLPRFTAHENVLLASSEKQVPHAFARCAEALLDELVGAQAAHSTAEELSGGTKRCVELCRALAVPSACVVLDEPFAGLDDAKKQQALAFIQREIAGRTLILVTHDARDAQKLSCTIIGLS